MMAEKDGAARYRSAFVLIVYNESHSG